jgi:hypothetical protein
MNASHFLQMKAEGVAAVVAARKLLPQEFASSPECGMDALFVD